VIRRPAAIAIFAATVAMLGCPKPAAEPTAQYVEPAPAETTASGTGSTTTIFADPYATHGGGGGTSGYTTPPGGNATYTADSGTAGDEVVSAPGGGRVHVVQKGETLYSLARKYYGNQARWRDIYNANASQLGNPNKLNVGTRLSIP
jgi:nucleoid-associated protein YgaU